MEKLRATLLQYVRWQPMAVYVDRIEGHLEADFSVSVENAKALGYTSDGIFVYAVSIKT
jgi:hypothetical protein